MDGRVFTTKELQDLGKNFNQLALEALEEEDFAKAKHWMQRSEQTKEYIHDMYLAWVPRLLSTICELVGEDRFVGILRESVRPFIEPIYGARLKIKEEGGWKAWMEFIVDTWRQHCGAWKIDEDDEKAIITHRPCGSGGQMVDRRVYDGIFGERKFQTKGFYTFSREGMPLYCGHCVWAHMVFPMKYQGEPLWVHDFDNPFPQMPGDPCIHYFYKDPRDIPEKYYAMVGMKKP